MGALLVLPSARVGGRSTALHQAGQIKPAESDGATTTDTLIWDAKTVKNEENAGQTPSESQPSERQQCLLETLGVLIQTMQVQTEAITRLAMSNEALVEALGQEDPDMLELPVRHLDGSPVL